MEYDSLTELNQLLADSGAIEFRAVLPEIPVNQTAANFYDWLRDAPDDWEENCRPMFAALDRLIRGAPDFGLAMAEIGRLQDELRPEEDDSEDDDYEAEEPGPEVGEPEAAIEQPVTQPPQDPAVAAKAAADVIGPALMEQLRAKYPEFAARTSPETLSKIATEAMGLTISEIDPAQIDGPR